MTKPTTATKPSTETPASADTGTSTGAETTAAETAEAARRFVNDAFAAVREHVAGAVAHELPAHGSQEWRNTAPDVLAERVAVHAAAGIMPVIEREVGRVSQSVLRRLLADEAWLARQGLTRTDA